MGDQNSEKNLPKMAAEEFRTIKVSYVDEIRRVKVSRNLKSLLVLKPLLVNLFPSLNMSEMETINSSVEVLYKGSNVTDDDTLQNIFDKEIDKVNFSLVVIRNSKEIVNNTNFSRQKFAKRFQRHYGNTGDHRKAKLPSIHSLSDWVVCDSMKTFPLMPKSFTSRFSSQLSFTLNGTPKSVDISSLPSLNMLLVDFLRGEGLTGTKVGCGEGGCGACTVVLTCNGVSSSINSCLRLLLSCDGCEVTTIEGLDSFVPNKNQSKSKCSDKFAGFGTISTTLAENGGTACGYCSSGMCMNMAGLLSCSNANEKMVEENLAGNICRCTGYRPILSAFKSLVCSGNCKSCPHSASGLCDIESVPGKVSTERLFFYAENMAWFRPSDLNDVFPILSFYRSQDIVVKLVVGNTSIGVEKYYNGTVTPMVYIDVSRIESLSGISVVNGSISIGASVTLNSLSQFLAQYVISNSQFSTMFSAISRHIELIANKQVRNVGSICGNMMLCHDNPLFASDICTILAGVDATVTISSSNSSIDMDMWSFLRYTFTGDEMITSVRFSVISNSATYFFDSFKVMQRHQNSHALVNATFSISTDLSGLITNSRLVFGGLVTGPLLCKSTSLALLNQSVAHESTLSSALSVLFLECSANAIDSPTLVPISPEYRQSLATSLFYKFFLSCQAQLPVSLVSAATRYIRPISSGKQTFSTDWNEAPVSEPIPKISGLKQTTGKAIYVSDRPVVNSALFGAYILSKVAHGTIVSIDTSEALAVEGVIDILFAKDVPNNNCGMFPGDEEVFASTTVLYFGQPIGLIIATSEVVARAASLLVNVVITVLPAILSLADAISSGSVLKPNQYMSQGYPTITCGDITKGFSQSDFVINGFIDAPGQAHFYMETQSCIVEPSENGLNVYCSSQGPEDVANSISSVINMPSSMIQVETARMGGAFGGKLTRCHPIAAALAVACVKHKKQVRMQLDRQTDMLIVGKRNPFSLQYSVGFTNAGVVTALSTTYNCDAGAAYDCTFGTADMCQLWADNTYYFQNYSSKAVCYFTNLPPNTACRAPGALSSITFVESIMEKISFKLGLPAETVREANFYKDGQLTPYLQPVLNMSLDRVWSTLLSSSNYASRLKEISDYNSTNRWTKRGISLVPAKYGIELAGNQHACLININSSDGTICVTHSGCECGQGLTTKVIQAVAYFLSVPMGLISNLPTTTSKTPNCTMTGGSSTSESVVMAAKNACDQLNTILAPYRDGKSWLQTVKTAYAAGCNISSFGWYAPQAGAHPFSYFVWAASCTEVLVDVLTGETQILQTDIVYDAGQSLNPLIDIGQIEGGFIMAAGHFLTEETVYYKDGRLINAGTWDYKPMLASDIPIQFNVTLLNNAPNNSVGNVLHSKASAEPPLCTVGSLIFAIKMAVQAARNDIGLTADFDLSLPATVPVIQQACGVNISQMKLQ